MDPALLELLDGDGDDIIEAAVRLRDPVRVPAGFRVVCQFGAIVTGRLARKNIRSVWSDPAVRSIKAARLVRGGDEIPVHEAHEPVAADERRPTGIRETGRGVVVGVIDWGLDFDARTFRSPDGASRVLALWDQRGTTTHGDADRYGYGRAFTQAEINAALGEDRPYQALGYHPGIAAPMGGAHGTHVADIAMGNGAHGGPVGIAPEADLIFVHLAAGALDGHANLGDSVRILEAVDFIDRAAGGRPCAINMSVGRHAGPHTGRTLLEQGLDAFLAARPGRAIIMSGGNYHMARSHASGRVPPGRSRTLVWRVEEIDPTDNEIELWYSNRDSFSAVVTAPTGEKVKVDLGENAAIIVGGVEVGNIYHRANDPNSPDHHLNIFLYVAAPRGDWRLTLRARTVVDGRFHAWVERDAPIPGAQSRFVGNDIDTTHTIGSICNGFLSIACGAADTRSGDMRIADFSSEGPTRDGRQKPDIVAPGVAILAASSPALTEARSTNALTRKSGASQAAPYAAGVAALVFEAAGRPLAIHETRRALIGTAQPQGFDPTHEARFGAGLLDIKAAIQAVKPKRAGRRSTLRTSPTPQESIMPVKTLSPNTTTAARLFDSIAYGAPGSVDLADEFEVIARPGEQLDMSLEPHDIVIRRALADGDCAHIAQPRDIHTLTRDGRLRRDTLVLRRRPGSDGEQVVHACLPGEGPPAAVPDPEGKALHPLVYRGASAARSRNPTVGDAQELLNVFLSRLDSSFSTCTFAQPSHAARARQLLGELTAAGQNPLVVDCRFGPSTEKATKLFQLCRGIGDDGKIGRMTWPLLEAFRGPGPSPPPPPSPPGPPAPISILDPARWEPILRGAFITSPALHTGNAVKFLVDGATTFRHMVASIRSAKTSKDYIYLLAWILIDDFELIPGDPTSTMQKLLTDASARGVQIRVMLWDQFDRDCLAKNKAAADRINALSTGAAIVDNETLLTVAGIKTGSHHQKVLVVKREEGLVAFCGGLDPNVDRIQAKAGCGGGSGGSGSGGGGRGEPLHDVHSRIVGPSAFDLLKTFIGRWDHHPAHVMLDAVKGPLLGRSTPRPAALPSTAALASSVSPRTCGVAIARTFLPVHKAIGVRRECDIRALLLASIRAAQRFIYMEEQYLVSLEAARALNAAIPRLSHVTIVTTASEIATDLKCPWGIRRDFINAATAGLSAADRAKFRVFHLVTPGKAGAARFGAHTYVHAKTWVFDDELAVIGTANCNNRGWESDSEVDAFIFDDAASVAATPISSGAPAFAQGLRMRLWHEHLGLAPSLLEDGVASASHWLSLPAGARVQRYNPTAGTDPLICVPPSILDPSAPCPGPVIHTA